ncbi:MAG: dihydrolipoyl dehydrogenase [Bacteroidaceae bacterium]|nr:dihydrolipoyl dehydrogenase [Bacteroidaceae bacterium]
MNPDIIIIGAGPGGYETAVRAAKLGLEVVVIEKDKLGGTCLNAGCIPTKCLCHSADTLEVLKEHSIQPDAEELANAVAHKDETVEKLRSGVAMLMKTPGITLVEGEAQFVDAHTVKVMKEGSEQVFSAPNIIIATGSTTKFLPIEGAHARNVLTSTEILNLSSLPNRLCIIGGGVIGIEFASIFRSFGVEVDVVEYMKEILPPFDRDVAKRLRTSLKKRGINFHLGAAVKAIHEGEPMLVDFEEKGKLQQVECDMVLMAVGRAANVDALNLNDVGITYTPRGICVDENMQTCIPGVYAIGDVNGLCQLAHAATFQGYCALEHITNPHSSAYRDALNVIPSAVFSNPEAAMVGATEEQLTEAGVEYRSLKSFYRANGKALSMDADEGIVKLLVSPKNKLLGAHILGTHASDMIHELALLMRMGGTVSDIAHTVHAHPSLSEIILAASEAL